MARRRSIKLFPGVRIPTGTRRRRPTRIPSRVWTHPGCAVRHRSLEAAQRCAKASANRRSSTTPKSAAKGPRAARTPTTRSPGSSATSGGLALATSIAPKARPVVPAQSARQRPAQLLRLPRRHHHCSRHRLLPRRRGSVRRRCTSGDGRTCTWPRSYGSGSLPMMSSTCVTCSG